MKTPDVTIFKENIPYHIAPSYRIIRSKHLLNTCNDFETISTCNSLTQIYASYHILPIIFIDHRFCFVFWLFKEFHHECIMTLINTNTWDHYYSFSGKHAQCFIRILAIEFLAFLVSCLSPTKDQLFLLSNMWHLIC